MRAVKAARAWLKSRSDTQRWIIFVAVLVVAVMTFIHNPISGYDWWYGTLITEDPMGPEDRTSWSRWRDPKIIDWGYFNLGIFRIYSFNTLGVAIVAAIGVALFGKREEG